MNGKYELVLPYDIIEITKGTLYDGDKIAFKMRLYEIPIDQTMESLKFGGVNANFDIIYETRNIKANIVIDTTVGNMYDFYQQLMEAYEKLNGKAILKNYGSSRCNLTVTLSKNGHCNVNGYINDISLNGVNINIDIDQSYCYQWINNFKVIFNELGRIQGDKKFLY